MECVYLIKHNQSGLYKIGMTKNWDSRSKQLKVGSSTSKIKLVSCRNSEKWEKVLHAMFKHKRIPQSEWFQITEQDAIAKMNWLADKTNQKMVIGNWHLAEAGHYYRRRKSRYENWYTETKSAIEHQRDLNNQLEREIEYQIKEKTRSSRLEPGYWPSKENKNELIWADKDPTYLSPSVGCLVWAFLIIGLLYFFSTANLFAFLITIFASFLFYRRTNN